MKNDAPPRAFISYAWTDADHQQWVIDLATRLKGEGIDVVLDVWNLTAGQDKYHYMERMVADPEIGYVLMICNARYAKKANAREGGVGDETTIITPEVYSNAANTKFIPVLSERDAEGKAILPSYLTSRIYVDLSSDQVYEDGYEMLLRKLHGEPEFPEPPLGKKPAYLQDGATIGSTTRPKLKRAITALEQGKPSARAAAGDHFEAVAEAIANLRIEGQDRPLDDLILEAIRTNKHLRDETLDLVEVLVGAAPRETAEHLLLEFFERLLGACHSQSGSATEAAFEAVRFMTMELFLHVVTVLLNGDHLEILTTLLEDDYVYREFGNRKVEKFGAFYFSLDTIDRRRKQRLGVNRTSLVADLIKERADRKKSSFERLQEVDLLLYLRSQFTHGYGWYPKTLVYLSSYVQPFDIFVAEGSKRRFARLSAVLDVRDTEELRKKYESLDPSVRSLRFHDTHAPISITRLMNLQSK